MCEICRILAEKDRRMSPGVQHQEGEMEVRMTLGWLPQVTSARRCSVLGPTIPLTLGMNT